MKQAQLDRCMDACLACARARAGNLRSYCATSLATLNAYKAAATVRIIA